MALYSHSRLTSYDRCPRKFLWRYEWNVRPRVEGVEAFTGKRVHETLEALYETILRGDATPAREDVVGGFHDRWDRTWNGSVRIVADRPADSYRRDGAECVDSYYRRHHPFRAGTTLAVERTFEVPLDETHRIRGIIDRIDIGSDGALEIHDYKTGKRTPRLRTLEEDLQVGLYEMAARHLYPERRQVRMVWHYLRSGVERAVEDRGPEPMRSLRRSTRRRIDAIEDRIQFYRGQLDRGGLRDLAAAKQRTLDSVPLEAREESRLFPAKVSALCRWCSFLEWCPEGSRHADRPFRPPPPPRLPAPRTVASADPRQPSLF